MKTRVMLAWHIKSRTEVSERNRRLHTFIMVGLTLLYAMCFVAVRIGLLDAPPLTFAALRVLLAGVALLALAWWRVQPVRIPRRYWLALLGLMLSSGIIGYGAMFLSPGSAGAGIGSVLGNTQPLVVIAAMFLHERLPWRCSTYWHCARTSRPYQC